MRESESARVSGNEKQREREREREEEEGEAQSRNKRVHNLFLSLSVCAMVLSLFHCLARSFSRSFYDPSFQLAEEKKKSQNRFTPPPLPPPLGGLKPQHYEYLILPPCGDVGGWLGE